MRKALLILTLIGASTGIAAAYNRDNCPGFKICPLTGQLICIAQCPLEN